MKCDFCYKDYISSDLTEIKVPNEFGDKTVRKYICKRCLFQRKQRTNLLGVAAGGTIFLLSFLTLFGPADLLNLANETIPGFSLGLLVISIFGLAVAFFFGYKWYIYKSLH
ncbi:MAG: hypothetical protein ACFFC7_11090 [Candidatus Hermodarchaeota archaeon]